MPDWNEQVIAEFRANDGAVGGNFAGAKMVLLHHAGRRSGAEYIAPVMYFTDDGTPFEGGTTASPMYVVASAAGAPQNPQWYANLTHAGRATVEVGAETVEVRVEDLAPAERERVFSLVKAEVPGFRDYETKVEGIRVIPVLALHRDAG